ncbi:MAG: hypothetical protein ABL986_18040 [Vicinamibacterales bacterium]
MGAFLVQEWWIVLMFLASLAPLLHRLATGGLVASLRTLDRRWIFLLMFWAVAFPIYYVGVTGKTLPEVPGLLAQSTFDEIERLAPGDPVLLAFDYEPSSAGELTPMATAFVRHAAEKRLRMYFVALWPLGAQMIDDVIERVLTPDFPQLQYGRDFVNLGYKSGQEAVIKVIVTNLRELYTTDVRGTAVQNIPMMEGIASVQQMKLIIDVSAGTPGTKEWVQYAVTPYPSLRIVAGVTGVSAPLYYPYIPRQLHGLLGAIKGAAEYEQLVLTRYGGENPNPKYTEGLRRMGPQLVAHLLIIGLIVVANILYFTDPSRARR